MKELLLGGLLGLLLGIAQVRMQLHRRTRLRQAAAWWDVPMLRSLLLARGAGTMLSALMMWLAVIDVDTVAVPPLHLGTLVGGVIFGVALGCTGATPMTSGVLLGAGPAWEGLCAVLGCVAGALLLPWAEKLFQPLQRVLNAGAYTWFRVTLDEKYLFPGGFLGQGCLGACILAAALCIRRPARPEPAPAPEPPVPDASAQPEDVAQDAVVLSLPGEEPVVVDTGEKEEEHEETADSQ